MAEATFEVVYLIISKVFNQISNLLLLKKNFNLSTFKIFAFGSHFKSVYCLFQTRMKKNYLTYIDSSRFRRTIKPFFSSQNCFSVPFIFTCFKYLVSPAKEVKKSELFDKLKLTLTYYAQPVAANFDLLDFTAIKDVYPIHCFLQYHLTNKLHQMNMFARNLWPLGDRNELITQLRLLHRRRQTNPQDFRLQFQRNTQKADMFKDISWI